ncbi:hypothetical protein U1Q18_014744 [Sarracenia purpurea var. burkii]
MTQIILPQKDREKTIPHNISHSSPTMNIGSFSSPNRFNIMEPLMVIQPSDHHLLAIDSCHLGSGLRDVVLQNDVYHAVKMVTVRSLYGVRISIRFERLVEPEKAQLYQRTIH